MALDLQPQPLQDSYNANVRAYSVQETGGRLLMGLIYEVAAMYKGHISFFRALVCCALSPVPCFTSVWQQRDHCLC